jgi:hypothetical protein
LGAASRLNLRESVGRDLGERLDLTAVPFSDRGLHGSRTRYVDFEILEARRDRDLLDVLGIARVRRDQCQRLGFVLVTDGEGEQLLRSPLGYATQRVERDLEPRELGGRDVMGATLLGDEAKQTRLVDRSDAEQCLLHALVVNLHVLQREPQLGR